MFGVVGAGDQSQVRMVGTAGEPKPTPPLHSHAVSKLEVEMSDLEARQQRDKEALEAELRARREELEKLAKLEVALDKAKDHLAIAQGKCNGARRALEQQLSVAAESYKNHAFLGDSQHLALYRNVATWQALIADFPRVREQLEAKVAAAQAELDAFKSLIGAEV